MKKGENTMCKFETKKEQKWLKQEKSGSSRQIQTANMQFVLGAGLTEDLDIMSLSAKAQMLSYMSFLKLIMKLWSICKEILKLAGFKEQKWILEKICILAASIADETAI